MERSKGLLALALAAPLAVAATTQHDAAIEKTAEAYRQAVLAGDSAAVAGTYARDAVEMPPGRPEIRGSAAIRQYYDGLFAAGKVAALTFPRLETASAGTIGFAAGAFERTLVLPSGAAVEDSGSFVVVVKREGNAWKSAYVIYNSDRPPTHDGVQGAVFPSPLPPLLRAYAPIAGRWFLAFAVVALGCASIPVIFGPKRRPDSDATARPRPIAAGFPSTPAGPPIASASRDTRAAWHRT